MAKRYYYTDTDAAKWMHSHHGVKLTANNGMDIFYMRGEWWFTDNSDGLASLMGDDYYQAYPNNGYYIHPDSEHILEPQVGDINVGSTKSDRIRVIQRNGKAFMWPEVEDV